MVQDFRQSVSGIGSHYNILIRNKTILLAFLMSFICTLDIGMINIATPHIAQDLNTGMGLITWVLVIYLLSMTGFLMISGKLIDVFGFRRTVTTGFLIYLAGLVLGLSSQSITMLLIAQFIQGVGGSILIVGTPSLIKLVAPRDQWPAAFGALGISTSLGFLLGSPLGGLLLDIGDWRSIYWFLLVPATLGMILFVILGPSKEVRVPSGQINLPLSAVFFFSIVAFIVAVNQGDDFGWTSPFILSLVLASLVLAVLFIVWNKRAQNPLLDFSLLKRPAFAWGSLCGFIAKFSDNGPLLLIPFYFALVGGLDAWMIGLVMSVRPVFTIIGSAANAAASRLAVPATIMILAMACLGCSYIGFVASPAGAAILVFIVLMAFRGIGIGFFYPQNRALIMAVIPPGEEGSGAGFMKLMEQLGVIVSIIVFEAIYSACISDMYQGDSSASTLLPADVVLPAFQVVFLTAAILAGVVILILWALRKREPYGCIMGTAE